MDNGLLLAMSRARYLPGGRAYEMRTRTAARFFPDRGRALGDKSPDLHRWVVVRRPGPAGRLERGAGERLDGLLAGLDSTRADGFGSYARFHRVFKRLTGRSPAGYRRGLGAQAT